MALEILQVDKRPRTSFAIALDENPVLCDGGNCSSSTQAASAPRAIEVAVQQSRKLKPMQPESRLLRSPPPLPPKGVRPLADTATFATKQSNDADGEQHYTLTLSPGEENKQLTDAIVAEVEPSVGINCRSPPPSVSPSPPSSRRLIVTTKTLSSNNSSQSPFPDKDLDRSVTQSMQNPQRNTPSSPRPIPPPRSHRQHRHSTPSHLDNTPTAQDDKTTKASPVNFLATDAGNECGRFLVDYLGSREIDQFTSIVDECAEKMMNSKPSVRSTQVVAYITTERVRLVPPRAGPLFKSLAVKSILCVNQCSKNRRIIGIVMWKPRTKPVCHLLRCTDQLISNSFFEAMFHVIQSQEVAVLSKIESPVTHGTPSDQDLQLSFSSASSSESDLVPYSPSGRKLMHSIPAVHIGSIKVGKLHRVSELVQKVLTENPPSRAREVSVWLSLAQVQLVDKTYQWEFIYAMHDTSCIQAVGVYPDDRRFFGYIIQEKHKPLMGHVLWCTSTGLVASLLSYLKQACQLSLREKGEESPVMEMFDEAESVTQSVPQASDARGIISRLRSLTMPHGQESHTPSHSSFHSYMGGSPKSSVIYDYSRKRMETVTAPTIISGMEFSEEDYVRFSVNYVGSATLDPPFTPQSITRAMQMFNQNGVAAGMAAVPKNTISMHVCALGINLSDKKQQMFVTRNYPRKQIAGHCSHQMDNHYFGFATWRPGFGDLKVHVFMQVAEPVTQILDSIKFWLQIDPL